MPRGQGWRISVGRGRTGNNTVEKMQHLTHTKTESLHLERPCLRYQGHMGLQQTPQETNSTHPITVAFWQYLSHAWTRCSVLMFDLSSPLRAQALHGAPLAAVPLHIDLVFSCYKLLNSLWMKLVPIVFHWTCRVSCLPLFSLFLDLSKHKEKIKMNAYGKKLFFFVMPSKYYCYI